MIDVAVGLQWPLRRYADIAGRPNLRIDVVRHLVIVQKRVDGSRKGKLAVIGQFVGGRSETGPPQQVLHQLISHSVVLGSPAEARHYVSSRASSDT